MSLIRQIWLLLFGAVLLAFAGSVAVNVDAARDTLQTQLRLKNSDNATALAMLLSQQKGDRETMSLLMAAQFDTGFYRRIRMVAGDGAVLFVREAQAAPQDAPAWFVAALPVDSAPGSAQVSDGWRALGSVEVVSHSAYAHDELWHGSLRSAGALAVVALLAGLLGSLVVSRIRVPLERTVEQARRLELGEYLTVAEPNTPELKRVTRAMNSLVARVKRVFEAQAEQVETLRRQATCDTLTGLSNRAHFMAQLAAMLQHEDGAARGGLVLLRLLDLAELNRSLGHAATDRLIGAVAQVLQTYSRRADGCFVGRLNGSDFALALPVGGVAQETAQAITQALAVALPAFGSQCAAAAGAVEIERGVALPVLMSVADLALARAESQGPFAVDTAPATGEGGAAWAGRGEGVWRDRLRQALSEGRARLASFPVIDAARRVLHLESPLRLQLDTEPGAPEAVASAWLPLAIRSRLTAAADECAMALALAAIAADGQPRGINLSPASLADSGFASRMVAQLFAAPRAARALWVEIGEVAAAEHFPRVRDLARQLRPLGVRFGLEHAGERLGRIPRLMELGLDYVKLDTAITLGVGSDPIRADFVKGLATLLHSLSVQVIAEGVSDESDAQALWACGVDGVTGPWVGAA
jgi:diguanylate cyclase (GGDEF)-like protein